MGGAPPYFVITEQDISLEVEAIESIMHTNVALSPQRKHNIPFFLFL